MNLFITLIAGLFVLVGTFFAFYTKKNKSMLSFSICIAFSILIILGLFELLPESFELLTLNSTALGIISLIIAISIGYVVLKLLDMFIPHHEHNHKHDKDHHKNLHHVGLVGAIALIIHNLIEGAALYNALNINLGSGLMMGLAIAIHNIPLGMFVAASLYKSTKNKGKVLVISLLIALSMFLGGILSHLIPMGEFLEGILLAITFGMIMYIALFELFPHIKEMKKKRLRMTGLVFGIIIMVVSMMIH